MPPTRWPKARRLDARRMAEAIRDATGVDLQIEGPCPGGQVGAAYVGWPDGHRGVLTWRPGISLDDLRGGPLAVIEALRRAGYPAPRAELAAQVGDDAAIVWEFLPGGPVTHFTGVLLDQALALNELQASRLAGRDDVPAVRTYLTEDGPGYCLHQPLIEHGARTRRLERWITQVGARHPGHLNGDDAVHCDFQPGNFLAQGETDYEREPDGGSQASGGSQARNERMTGVVDWDGAGRGDRRLDLVTLRFGLHAIRTGPGVTARLDSSSTASRYTSSNPCGRT